MAKNKSKGNQNMDENGTILANPPKAIGNVELFQRLNYLYQLSTWNTMLYGKNDAMSRSYIKNLDFISKKTKCGLLPSIKRTICKKCKRVLIPKKTCTYSVSSKLSKRKKHDKEKIRKNEDFIVTCVCGEVKTFRVGLNRSHATFYEKEGTLINL
ncbi:hypothetical protein KAFR_0F02200 [Kazachstania africana CBS 2517]|uniref:Uncharacterized protein n=1 Tax=Kazachstania africana (strain ATCC 22294 / BCRC 22015 / CBS 2517 / CECT 1963 / NBRC 1671 / NRRL Y-8276) TaxID=1071382 RepID=H2AWR7_KAZAF|nr:hypothetical protein KAFR_0F02200 [Kazachstania africana CBS 2517]CCF58817.1 hypothetical protein KAFR_0F02200 [Kazachstania africana CBS 2517]